MKEKIEVKHHWGYCKLCETRAVFCGTCGNNCCNGGYGSLGDGICPDCPSAYELQEREFAKENPNH